MSRQFSSRHFGGDHFATSHLSGAGVPGARYWAGKHWAGKHFSSEHFAGLPEAPPGGRYWSGRHFRNSQFATDHFSGHEVDVQPQPGREGPAVLIVPGGVLRKKRYLVPEIRPFREPEAVPVPVAVQSVPATRRRPVRVPPVRKPRQEGIPAEVLALILAEADDF